MNIDTFWQWDILDPFGANMPNENPAGLGAFNFNLRFPGHYYDRETNLHYNIFRDYDPTIGRYTESDPVGLMGGVNTYTYVRGNPLSKVDPFGLWSFTVEGYGVFGGAITIGQDNSTGQWFYGGRFGYGVGGGFSLDPEGKRPGAAETTSCNGTTVGTFGQLGVTVGPFSWNPVQAAAGIDTTSGQSYHEGPVPADTASFTKATTFEIGGSFGVEVIGH